MTKKRDGNTNSWKGIQLMSMIVTSLMSRNVHNGENSKSGRKKAPDGWRNINEVTKSASYKVEKLTKFAMGLENIQIG